MSSYLDRGRAPRTPVLLAVVVATAVLHLAREVLIPLALAILLSFLLAPAARRLERWGLGRIASTLLVVLASFAVIGAVAYVAGSQAVSLAANLPEYRENIAAKIRDLRSSSESGLGKAAEAIKELENQAAPGAAPVAVMEAPASPLAAIGEMLAPIVKPAGTALAVIVFTILMLLNRESMRERLIALVGAGRINVTTQAMGEAAYRVSRYLFMQLLINASFGIPFGIALYFIGIPNAALWGLLAVALRFIPYAGVWIAVAMPALLAFAISDGWSMVAWTLGVFVVLELLAVYLAEPWLYGKSAGLSPFAIITAAIFWTWLWGPVGLLLATPLTVCLAVMGRYIPKLGFLNVLLGVEQVLPAEGRFYQRLVSLDREEAADLAAEQAEALGVTGFFDAVLLPAMALAERDRHQGELEPHRERFIMETLRTLIDDLAEEPAPRDKPRVSPVCVVAAHDEADHIAGLALARSLPAPEFHAIVAPFPILAAETMDLIAGNGCQVVCVSAVPPHAATNALSLAKRLRKRFPALKIVVALWCAEGDLARARERLAQAGADHVVTRLPEAIQQLRELVAPLSLVLQRS
jgi:predicted PurR-regulated permease PerM